MPTDFPVVSVSGCAALRTAGAPAPEKSLTWVRFSLPLPPKRLAADAPLTLVSPQDVAIPLQAKPLAHWPDGSLRWLDCQALVAQDGAYRLLPQRAGTLDCPPADVSETDGQIRLANGIVSLILGAENGPIQSISYLGREVSDRSGPLEATASAAAGGGFSSRHGGPCALRIVEHGPVRVVAEAQGALGDSAGRRMLSYRLRCEIVAGLPVILLRYRFSHEDPGREIHKIRRHSLWSRWRSSAPPRRYLQQNRYSLLSVPRAVETTKPVDIRSDPENPKIRVHNLECLDDTTEYPFFSQPPMDDALPYLGLGLESGSVTAWVDDFQELCPKGLVSRDQDLGVEIWPEWAGALNLPQGWSREIVVRLIFSPESRHPGTAYVLRHARATADEGRAALPADWYTQCGCFHMGSVLSLGKARRFDRYLATLTGLPTVIGMWSLGDTIDPGYTSTYARVGRLPRRAGSPPRRFYTEPNFDQAANMQYNEPVWTNNEYDVIICLARECMRRPTATGLRQKLRWFSRHAIEVDFIRYSDHFELHQGSPAHSLDHCQASAYPSHLWCEGLLAYYCLSGDEDALDVAVRTGDFIIRTFADPGRRSKLLHFTREIGWALLHTATLADLTREKRFLEISQEFARLILQEPLTDELARTMLVYSFGYASLALGMEALHRVTDDPRLKEWLARAADAVLAAAERDVEAIEGAMTWNYYNAAYEITRDLRYVRAGMGILERLMDSKAWHDPWLHTKPVAMTYRGLSRFLGYACEAGFLKELDYRFYGGIRS